ncbi:MAG: amidase family protein, partial [Steroidobacteraceae bacterium]
GRSLRADLHAAAVTWLQLEARRISTWCEQYDVLLTPTLASPPPVHGALRPPSWQRLALDLAGRLGAGGLLKWSGMLGDAARQAFSFIPWTPVFNATGQPAMSVPIEWTEEGLPVGMHFVARYGDEATLFRLASQLEVARPWFHRRPAVG